MNNLKVIAAHNNITNPTAWRIVRHALALVSAEQVRIAATKPQEREHCTEDYMDAYEIIQGLVDAIDQNTE